MQFEACAVSYARGSRQLFANIDIAMRAGSALLVQGANGAGKTSLLRMLTGLLRPDTGCITWNGTRIGPGNHDFQRALAYIGHQDGLKNELSACENLVYGALLGAADAPAQARRALAAAGLAAQADLPCRALSQGQRKRVALARLHLPSAPLLWILDEPFSALDGEASASLGVLLEQHCERGGMLVYTTHQDQLLPRSMVLDLNLQPAAPC